MILQVNKKDESLKKSINHKPGRPTCVWTVQAKRRRIPASQDVSSRQKLALCPSATLCPVEASSKS